MAVKFEPLNAEDALLLNLQDIQVSDGFGLHLWTADQWKEFIVKMGKPWQAKRNGVFLGCAGITPVWSNRAFAWMAVSKEVNRYDLLAIHRMTEFTLSNASYTRIETTVREGFLAGIRWAMMLGFKHEGIMRKYAPDGANHHLFARIM